MIKQTTTGLDDKSLTNTYNEDGFLPLITAPMYSVVDENNYQVFLDNKVQVCLPRKTGYVFKMNEPVFISLSLQEFIETYLDLDQPLGSIDLICIDTANGNMPALHEAIRKAKEIHGDNLVIMAGNVASVEAFVELAKTGVDYIRVGIGGGGSCQSSSNTGVGQEDLGELIFLCSDFVNNSLRLSDNELKHGATFLRVRLNDDGLIDITPEELKKVSKVKIVADGISTYIKQCESKYGFNDNGYAAINKLLFAGADLVMIGKLFAQCLESSGEKKINQWHDVSTELSDYINDGLMVKYSGMSTHKEQEKHKQYIPKLGDKFKAYPSEVGFPRTLVEIDSEPRYWDSSTGHLRNSIIFENEIKPSEGSVQWIPVRWTLKDWLLGSKEQDTPPYLNGFVNSLKSAMSYTGAKTLKEFHG